MPILGGTSVESVYLGKKEAVMQEICRIYFKDQDPDFPLISGRPLPKDPDGVVRNKRFIECDFHPNCEFTRVEGCEFIRCNGRIG